MSFVICRNINYGWNFNIRQKINGNNGFGRGSEVFIKINNGWHESFSQNVSYVNYKYIDSVIYLE